MTDAFAMRSDEERHVGGSAVGGDQGDGSGHRGTLDRVDVTDPPGVEAPLHVHHREDEAFLVLEGDVTIEVGGKTIEANAGDFVFGPRDIPHRYTVGDSGSRMLFILTPGGFEDLSERRATPLAADAPPGGPSNARRGADACSTSRSRLRAGGLKKLSRSHRGPSKPPGCGK